MGLLRTGDTRVIAIVVYDCLLFVLAIFPNFNSRARQGICNGPSAEARGCQLSVSELPMIYSTVCFEERAVMSNVPYATKACTAAAIPGLPTTSILADYHELFLRAHDHVLFQAVNFRWYSMHYLFWTVCPRSRARK